MVRENKITVLSTFANDKLVGEDGSVLRKQNGGPALYLQQALENEGAFFILRTGAKMEVEVLMTQNGEFGKVSKKPTQRKVRFSQIKTPFLLISSVLNEFNLANLPTFKGKVFLDIQGYVRNGNDFGKKSSWNPRREVFENIFCLKGTMEESQNLPIQYIQAQKQKILLITKGKRGCEVFAFGKRYTIKPTKIVVSKKTIGAGDTFFAYFVSRFVKTENVLASVRYAVKRTSLLLSARNIHHHNHLSREEVGCG